MNGLTKLDTASPWGSAVHVKGTFAVSANTAGSLLAMQFVATEIRKSNAPFFG